MQHEQCGQTSMHAAEKRPVSKPLPRSAATEQRSVVAVRDDGVKPDKSVSRQEVIRMSCLASVGSEGFEFAIRGRSRPVAGAARGVSLSTWSSDAGKSVAHTIIGPCTLHLGSSSGR